MQTKDQTVPAAPSKSPSHTPPVPPALQGGLFGMPPASDLAVMSLPDQHAWISLRLDPLGSNLGPNLGPTFGTSARLRQTSLDYALASLALACLPLVDVSPLEFLFCRALELGILEAWAFSDQTQTDAAPPSIELIRIVSQAPDSSLLRLVRTLLARSEAPETSYAQVDAIEKVLCALLEALPFFRLPARCVVDRALQRHFPAARTQLVSEAMERVLFWAAQAPSDVSSAPQPAPSPVPDRQDPGLERLPRVALATRSGLPLAEASLLSVSQLQQLSSAASGDGTRLNTLEACLAECTLEVLANQPRGVSQANAEELLAKRVYTDPGHFMIELLQNAEDAGARHWCLRLESGSLQVAHDGQPFDCRDVVGVTSIGQTTKVQQQIGMFGVGFKSVYEVTRRPRIRSGGYHFELVDVSVPRALPRRREAFPEHFTVLELPLETPGDPLRSASALFAKACGLSPSVLLTLRNLQVLELHLVGPAGGYKRICKLEEALDGPDLAESAPEPATEPAAEESADATESTDPTVNPRAHRATPPDGPLRCYLARLQVRLGPQQTSILRPAPHAGKEEPSPPEHTQSFLVFETLLPVDRTLRVLERRTPARQADSTRILIGFELDGRGLPIPQSTQAAQIYSWLPTAERPGLRFFVQAHFDVPVDRERASPGSAFNAWLVDQLPCLLREGLAAHVHVRYVHALLECLPLPGELKGVLFEGLPFKIVESLRSMPLLLTCSGQKAAPAHALLLEEALRPLLALHPTLCLPVEQLLNPSIPPRLQSWAQSAGARVFGLEQLIEALEATLLDPTPSTATLDPPAADGAAQDADAALDFSQKLLEVLASHPDVARFFPRIRKLPLLPDVQGQLRSADSLTLGNEAIRSIYQSTYRIFIHPKLDVNVSKECSPQHASMLSALELQRMDEVALASDLSAGRTFERSVEALGALHQRLAEHVDTLSPRLWRTLALLPVWPDQTGRLRTLAGSQRALIPGRQSITQLFPEAPFLETRVAELPHTAATQVPRVGLLQLLLAFLPQAAHPLRLEPTPQRLEQALHIVLDTLEASPDEVTASVRSLLGTQQLFLDQHRAPVALESLHVVDDTHLRVLLEPIQGLRVAFPESPTYAVIQALSLPARRLDPLGLWSLLTALPRCPAGQEWASAARARLCDDAPLLPLPLLQKAVSLSLFPDVLGRLGPLTDSDPEGVLAAEPMWCESLSRLGFRLLDPSLQNAVLPLLHALSWKPAAAERVIRRLATFSRREVEGASTFFEPDHLDWVQQQLVEQKPRLQELFPVVGRSGLPSANPTLSALPLWRSLSGSVKSAETLVEPPGTEPSMLDMLEPDEIPESRSLSHLLQLKPLVMLCPLSIRLQRLLQEQVQSLKPLEKQPRALQSPTRLTQVLAHQLVASVREPWHEPPLLLPLLDALGRVRLDTLKWTDLDTSALLLKLKPAKERQGWQEGPHPLVGQLLHPVLADALGSPPPTPLMTRLIPLPDRDAVGAICEAWLEDAELPALWEWLELHLPQIGADSSALRQLRLAPLFLTAGGRRVRSDALSLDPLFEGTELDVRPSPRLATERLARIQAVLHSGREQGVQLALSLVLHAWRVGVESRSLVRLHEALRILAGWVTQEGPSVLERVLKALEDDAQRLLLPDALEKWRPLDALCLPPNGLRDPIQQLLGDRCPIVHPALDQEPIGSLLKALRLRVLPTLEQLCWAAVHASGELTVRRALCLVAVTLAEEAEAGAAAPTWSGWSALCRSGHAWLLDGTGALRAPQDLFVSAPELEGLIGTTDSHPERFVHPELEAVLGRRALLTLPLLREKDIQLSHIIAELTVMSSLKRPVGFRIYRWLEAGLRTHRLDPGDVKRALAGLAWVCTDDGDWFDPKKVLGVPAWTCFGRFRGYWLRGVRECPLLCALFEIPDTLGPDVLIGFFQELAGLVTLHGDRVLLEREPALPRMVLACTALLGGHSVAIPEGLPVILAEAAGAASTQEGPSGTPMDEPAGTRRLLAVGSPGLVRSVSPALETIFQQGCRYYKAILGPPDEREQVEACLICSKIPRLEELIVLELATDGVGERTAERSQAIRGLRTVLGSLLEVLPRVKRQRRWLDTSGWRLESRLRLLALNAPIRCFDGLIVRYVFPGVGTVRVQSAAVLEPEWQGHPDPLLALDDQLLLDPLEYIGELASALVPAVYEGPGAEQLVDILELLLPLGSRDRMHRFLDQRHYPHAERQISGAERVWERLSGLLDYGLSRALRRVYPWLASCRSEGEILERWSGREMREAFLAVTSTTDAEAAGAAYARGAVARLRLDPASAPAGEVEALTLLLSQLFSARDLSEALAKLRTCAGDLSGLETSGDESLGPSQRVGQDPQQDWLEWDLPELDSALPESGANQDPPGTRTDPETLGWLKGILGGILPESGAERGAGGRSVLGRLGKWMGTGPAPSPESSPQASAATESALGQGNPFAPMHQLGDNRWATPERLKVLAALPSPAWLRHDPGVLVSPWSYAIRQVGGRFDPVTQAWEPASGLDVRRLQPGTRSGVQVQFQGHMLPGRSLLPLPLYSSLEQPPVLEGQGQLRVGRGRQGRIEVEVLGEGPVMVQYRVSLLEPPALGPGIEASWGDFSEAQRERYRQPTLGQDALPFRLRRWITSVLQGRAPLWERALAGVELVRAQTCYDGYWASQPRVLAAEGRLRPGHGQHALERFLAGGDSELLGRGICFELNLLVVEVLRQLEVPAMPAIGWLLDQGKVTRSDHLFALALLPGPSGPLLLPLDASVGPTGARSALRDQQVERQAGEALNQIPLAPAGVWALTVKAGVQGTASGGRQAEQLEYELRERAEAELTALLEARALLLRARQGAGTQADALRGHERPFLKELSVDALGRRIREEREALERQVGDAHQAALLLRLVKGELAPMPVVTPEIQALIRMGVARLTTHSVYQVVPVART